MPPSPPLGVIPTPGEVLGAIEHMNEGLGE